MFSDSWAPVKKLSAAMVAITAIWFVLLILAPFSLPGGSLYLGEGGGANRMDFSDVWKGMPLFPRVMYTIGDFNCHQNASRSFFLNGNQMPFCARDTGVFAGFIVGSFIVSLLSPAPSFYESLFSVLPGAVRRRAAKHPSLLFLILGSTFAGPMVLDGTIQLLTSYESNNLIRLLTGLSFGAFFMLAVGAMLISQLREIEMMRAVHE